MTTLNVTSNSDNNPGGIGVVGDLRYALNSMNEGLNTTPDDYAIVFAFPMTIQLNGILPIVNNSSNPVNITIGNPGSTPILVNSGAISPDAGGTLSLGSLTLVSAAASRVHTEVNSSGTSLVAVNGPASLAGTLEINLDAAANQPATYKILTSSGITDTFDSVSFTGATPVNYSVSYLPAGAPTYVQFDILLGTQAITNFTATPANPIFTSGGIFTVAATGGASANPVTFSIAAASSSVCSASGANGATITLLTAGTCSVPADQAGDVRYAAATQVSVDIAIGAASQTITFTSSPPSSPAVTGTYTVAATGGASGNAVTFSIDANSTAGACTIAGTVVSFTGTGTCLVDANQAGNTSYAAASVQQTIMIGKKTTTVSLVATPNPIVIGIPTTLTATVAGDPPTGTVSFTDNGTALPCSPVTLVPGTTSSTAVCTTTFTGADSRSIVATYSGEGNFAETTSAALVLSVNPPAVPATMLNRWALLLLGGLLGAGVFWRLRSARRQ